MADTIEEVRAMLPAGLVRIGRAVPEWGTVEVWGWVKGGLSAVLFP